MGMVYQWKSACCITVDAQVAGAELERIRVHHNGRLTQEDVVAAAAPPDAPLHPAFEWDDKAAATEYRLHQASHMIRSITVVADTVDGGPMEPIRAFVNVQRDQDRSYTSVAHAMSDADLRAQVLARALDELRAWQRKHAELVEFASVFAGIDEVAAKLTK